MSATHDLQVLADAMKARHGYSVRILRENPRAVPYSITIFDPKSTRKMEIRPDSMRAAIAGLTIALDTLWLARGQTGNYPA